MIRISHHPADQAFLLLRIDQLHNHVIGSFQPARRQDDLGVGIYVMETTNLPALQAWARHQDIHILDNTTQHQTPRDYCHRCGRQMRDNGCCDHPTRLPGEPAADPASHAQAARDALHARRATP